MTRADMVKAMQDFCTHTQRNWSILGFESAGQARASLGGDWFAETTRMLGYTAANVCTQVASATASGGQSGQQGQAGGQQGGQQGQPGGQQGPTGQGETGGQQGETGPGGSGTPR